MSIDPFGVDGCLAGEPLILLARGALGRILSAISECTIDRLVTHRGSLPTKHDVKDIIKTFEDYLQVLQTKTSRHQKVNNLEIIYYLRFA